MTTSPKILKILAATIWLAVGGLLLTRGVLMLRTALVEQGTAPWAIAVGVILGGWLGYLKGRYVLSRSARRNLKRIDALEEPRIWNVFSENMVFLIVLMIVFGMGLRSLASQGYIGGYKVVGPIYVGIGAALAISSLAYRYRRPPAAVDLCAALVRAGSPETPKEGVLLVNLGTPDSPNTPDVRRYLREFLSDPRVIEVNRALWWFVLNVIILPFRSGKSAELYKRVWTPEGSPLLIFSRRQRERLQALLGDTHVVALGMRYGNPSLESALDELVAAGCRRVTLLSLFPQFSGTTSGSVYAEAFRLVSRLRDQPTLRIVPPCFEDPGYIAALAELARETRKQDAFDHVVFSFHGIPEAYVLKGDPYADQCARTAVALAREMNLADGSWSVAFQSRFGDEPWLQPYIDEHVPALAATAPRVLVLTPGFAADCLETVDEIGVELAELFVAAGGRELRLVPSLNDHPSWIRAMADMVRRSGSGEVASAREAETLSRAL